MQTQSTIPFAGGKRFRGDAVSKSGNETRVEKTSGVLRNINEGVSMRKDKILPPKNLRAGFKVKFNVDNLLFTCFFESRRIAKKNRGAKPIL